MHISPQYPQNVCTKLKIPKKFSALIVHFLPKLCTKCTFGPKFPKICVLVYFCQKVCTKCTYHLDIAKICVLSAKTSKIFSANCALFTKIVHKVHFLPLFGDKMCKCALCVLLSPPPLVQELTKIPRQN